VNYLDSYQQTVQLARDAHVEGTALPEIPQELILKAIFAERRKHGNSERT
jgi:hypothetical protein